MKNKNKLNLTYSLLSLIMTSFLLVITIFGWYVHNKEVSVSSISAKTSDSSTIQILNEVTAVRHNLNGNVITDTYTRNASNGVLYLTERITRDVTGDEPVTTILEYTVDEKVPFNINDLLPGEYIDIKVGYNMVSGNNGKDYAIRLNNVKGKDFEVDGKTHYATGAFKYAPIKLEDESGNKIFDNSSSIVYSWFTTYSIAEDDVETVSPVLLNHTWQTSYENLYFTFRICEDFSQYYSLISQASQSYGALLSKKKVTIGDIYFLAG